MLTVHGQHPKDLGHMNLKQSLMPIWLREMFLVFEFKNANNLLRPPHYGAELPYWPPPAPSPPPPLPHCRTRPLAYFRQEEPRI